MKKILFFLSFATMAVALNCRYESGKFRVKNGERWYEQRVFPNVKNYSLVCGEQLATLYDGLDWTIFQASKNQFEWKRVSKDFPLPVARVSGTLAALYEGENVVVYDSGQFSQIAVNPKYLYTKLTVAEQVIVAYEGASLVVYSGGKFSKRSVRPRTSWARVHASGDLGMAYDGQDFFVVIPEAGWREFPLFEPIPTAQLSTLRNGAALCTGSRVYLFCRSRDRFEQLVVSRCEDLKLRWDGEVGFTLKGADRAWKLDPTVCSISAI